MPGFTGSDASSPLLRSRRSQLGLVWVVACVAVIALLAATYPSSRGDPVELLGSPLDDVSSDMRGLSNLAGQVDAAVKANKQLTNEYHSTFPGKPAPCTGLACINGGPAYDPFKENNPLGTTAADDADCCGDDAPPPAAGEAGDMSVGAVITALRRKFHNMKQKFREIRANYYEGEPRKITIGVHPRGPRGFTGMPGAKGPPGLPGAAGAVGPVGKKGDKGLTGIRGVQGRKGHKGMTGSIGEPGIMGPEGPQGKIGKQGFDGPDGPRGLPGAPGVQGNNGPDGVPGPPGMDSPAGLPGLPGMRGPQGAAGKAGAPGKTGPPGDQGQKGPSGQAGMPGPAGTDGRNGAGPKKPPPLRVAGNGDWGGCYLKSRECHRLGVMNNLCGECKPLCKNCDATAGFRLKNPDGLRYMDKAFDDNERNAGQLQPQNVCILARYGNKGTFTKTPEPVSYMKAVTNVAVKDQEHWFGNCRRGSTSDKTCCSNAFLLQSGFDWGQFSSGNSCGGDIDKDKPSGELFCVYDSAAFARQRRPPGPPKWPEHTMKPGDEIQSDKDQDKRQLLSKNGVCHAVVQEDGNLVVYRQGGIDLWSSGTAGKGVAPYKLVMQTDGNLVLYDSKSTALWFSATSGTNANKAVMQDDCNLVVYFDSTAKWDSKSSQSSLTVSDFKVPFANGICAGEECADGNAWFRLNEVADGHIETDVKEVKMNCAGFPKTNKLTVDFKVPFKKAPKVVANILSERQCWKTNANLVAQVSVVAVTTHQALIEVETWGGSNVWSVDVSWMAFSDSLDTNSNAVAPRAPITGDSKRGLVCVGRNCAGPELMKRMVTMANTKVQSGTADGKLMECGAPLGQEKEIVVNFKYPFSKPPKIHLSLKELEWCYSWTQNIRGRTWAYDITERSFKIKIASWADTRLQRFDVSWVAFAPELTDVNFYVYPYAPQPIDQVGLKACVGSTCVGQRQFAEMTGMGQWRAEVGSDGHTMHCGGASTFAKTIYFKHAFDGPPDVYLGVSHIDMCNQRREWKWNIKFLEITSSYFKVLITQGSVWHVQLSWVAISKGLGTQGAKGTMAAGSKPAGARPPLIGAAPPGGAAYERGAWPAGWCYAPDASCTTLGIKDNMCGKCDAWGNGGFRLSEWKAGLRFKGTSFDDNQIGKGTIQARNICILAKYGNKGTIGDIPTKKCEGSSTKGRVSNQVHWFGNCRMGDKNAKACCSNAFLVESGFDWTKFSKGNRCGGDSDLDRTLGEIKCEFRAPGATVYESGSWPEGWCHPMSADCKALGVRDNMCGTCQKWGNGFSLEESKKGLRFQGTSFDDNRIGTGTIQARNICILARYGNKGTIKDQPTKKCGGYSLRGAANQVHWFGNCYEGDKRQKECCSNAFIVQSGFDWTKFSKGNRCGGDSDTDRTLGKLECEFDSRTATNKAAYSSGAWPNGWCYPMADSDCDKFGVKDNMCGSCTKWGSGFQLEEPKMGLRFKGASFDDNQIGTGSMQARNICILAKFGNGGTITEFPTKNCGGFSQRGVANQVHWYGNCREGSKNQASCCSNAEMLTSGFDWAKFARGNSCRGDRDTDRVLGKVQCEFTTAAYREGNWPNGWCHPPDSSCKALGVVDNMCGSCKKWGNGGFELEETKAGLRFKGASFDDNQIGTGSYQAMNICILAKYGNKGTIVESPTEKCGGSSQRGVSSQVHWYGNCRKGSKKEKDCCSNAELLTSGFDWNKFSKGNRCGGDSDKDRVLGNIKCEFTSATYAAGSWPNGWCHAPDATCKSLGVADNLCGECKKFGNGGFTLKESRMGLRFKGASFDDNQIGKGTYQAMNICILAKYGNGGTITDAPTKNCGGKSLGGRSNQVHWYGNCRMGNTKEAACCSNAELLSSGFDWTKFSQGNKCGGDSDTDRTLGEVNCEFNGGSLGSRYSAGAWPTGWCQPLNADCKALGVTDNMCGSCEKVGNGFKLKEMNKGLRFNGASFDDNRIGKGSIQAQNICILAKYGNKGTIVTKPTADCKGTSLRGKANQVHWYGNCRDDGKEAACCSNAELLRSGFDWNKFSKGNSCRGDADTDRTLGEVECYFAPAGTVSAYSAGTWPAGWCYPLDADCTNLGIKDNMCGKCSKFGTGGFKLSETKMGLRFKGASFDDNRIGKGTIQAMNICTLAKFGNGGIITEWPTKNCAGYSQRGPANQVHWYGNCREGDTKQASCCSNAELLTSGFDWTKFARGNSCRGDRDTDRVLGTVECEFTTAAYRQGSWPNGWCHAPDATCKALGVVDNMCGSCKKWGNGGFELEETKAGLRFKGASFDDNQIGTGSYQAMNICILAKYGNKGTIVESPTEKCGGSSQRGVSSQVHWYGNCRKGSKKEKDCCSNAELLTSGFDWNKFSKGNRCGGDSDKDRVLGNIKCEFTSAAYAAGNWPNGWCHAPDATCKSLGVADNLCGECHKFGNGGFTLKESRMGLRFKGASFDDNQIGKGTYQAMNICILAKYGNGGTITDAPTKNCGGKSLGGKSNQVHWYGNCRMNSKKEAACCSNAEILSSGFDWTKFSQGNKCGGDSDTDRTLGEVNCEFNGGSLGSRYSAGAWPTGWCHPLDADCKALGVKDNLCGECSKWKGGFKLKEFNKGLRFNGASFDDNQIGKGSIQAQNICILAKYGNGGTITAKPTSKSKGHSIGGVSSQVHWYGNCRAGSRTEKSCCSNAEVLSSGFDWNKFSKGNRCSGDGDLDRVLGQIKCDF